MKKVRSIIVVVLLFVGAMVLEGCSGMHMGTSVGVSMNFGPNGPYVQPHMNVGLYGGGRW